MICLLFTENDEPESKCEETAPKSAVEQLVARQECIVSRKEKIASLASAIVAEPHQNVLAYNIDYL